MYVCLCHGLKSRDVEAAIVQGISRPADVHRHFGVEPQCGRCLSTIKDMAGDRRGKKDGKSGCTGNCGACG